MERKQFMTETEKQKLGIIQRTHEGCIRLVGVASPGKTAKDKARKGVK